MTEPRGEWTIEGKRLAELLLATRESFLRLLEQRELSQDYLRQSRFIIEELAGVCQDEGAANPWQLRQRYLDRRAALRSERSYSASHLENHGRELGYFLRWYQGQVKAGEMRLGELSAEQLQAYWSTQKGALPYRHKILSRHLQCLMTFLQRPDVELSGELETPLEDYFEHRRLTLHGEGYGMVMSHRAKIVTRRHLIWLEQQGHLPAGTAAAGATVAAAGVSASPTAACVAARAAHRARCCAAGLDTVETAWVKLDAAWATASGSEGPARLGERGPVNAGPNGHGMDVEWRRSGPEAVLRYVTARVDSALPEGLRQPLMEYLEHLVHERELVKRSIQKILRTTLALCRLLAEQGHASFDRLRVAQLDELVSSLISAPNDDLLRRRQQVQARHSELRGFLRYLHRLGLLGRDLAAALISPQCYRISTPPVVLSEQQVQTLLESVDRRDARGRRCYAILLLLTTYGLRPVDVARLRLDDLHWREEWLGLVQSKTGVVLTLPLLPEVAEALYAYLRQDRAPGWPFRQVFLSLSWPPHPLCSRTISEVVAAALSEAGLPWASARHLRASVATHLLRQGEPISTIQEVLGQSTPETTQRYAVTDLELLRQVLPESER